MNAQELRRWLKKMGCTFETHKSGSGHVTVKFGDNKTQLPMHGGRKELGTGLVNKIKKDLGLLCLFLLIGGVPIWLLWHIR